MKNNIYLLALFMAFISFPAMKAAAEESPRYLNLSIQDTVQPEPVILPAVSSANDTSKRYTMAIQTQYRNYDSVTRISSPYYGIIFKSTNLPRQQSWYLKAFASFSEAQMSNDRYMYISSDSQTAIFNSLSFFGFGGGLEQQFDNNFLFSGGGNFVFFRNKETRSGFNGLELECDLGYVLRPSPTMTIIPSLGAQWTYISGGLLDNRYVSFKDSLSGFGYHFQVEFGVKF
jgi:hypothetical protein